MKLPAESLSLSLPRVGRTATLRGRPLPLFSASRLCPSRCFWASASTTGPAAGAAASDGIRATRKWSTTPAAAAPWARWLPRLASVTPPSLAQRRLFLLSSRAARRKKKRGRLDGVPAAAVVAGVLVVYVMLPSGTGGRLRREAAARRRRYLDLVDEEVDEEPFTEEGAYAAEDGGEAAAGAAAWADFGARFGELTRSLYGAADNVEWASQLPDRIVGLMPDWTRQIPGLARKLQRELSMAPGSLADEIWREASDAFVNPEVAWTATVRVSDELCDDERAFLARRRRVTTVALAKYLGVRERDVHPDDVPVIAMCGSGGGLRALVAGAGSMLAAEEDGLFDCVTYTSGVSGSCWLQALYNSSIVAGAGMGRILDHLKARLGVHIAYPPAAFASVVSAPTNKLLLAGVVEKLRGDAKADFGLVDVYGILLAARLLVPKGELGVNELDFKLSNQRDYVKFGQNPLPIYTAVRHEIPDADATATAKERSEGTASEDTKTEAKRHAWFQWLEVTPYEFYCEEFQAGIPTWAMGRRFKGGHSIIPSELAGEQRKGGTTGADSDAEIRAHNATFNLPEVRMPLLLGIFGSAFCATLSHYYREIRPLIQSISGLSGLDEAIYGRNEDLSKVHPIDPAGLPNFVYGMRPTGEPGDLPRTTPPHVCAAEYMQLMDAGMSNNLPIYPLIRPRRGVEVLIAFDASADVRSDNWLSVADGYALQRGVKGWPVGIGWPKPGDSPAEAARQMEDAQPDGPADADAKLEDAKADQAARRGDLSGAVNAQDDAGTKANAPDAKAGVASSKHSVAGDLGYCTVWVGSTAERSNDPPPPSRAIRFDEAGEVDSSVPPDDEGGGGGTWQLTSPDAGLAVVYLPFLANPDKVPGVDPATSEYMSTWNFVYTPDQIDSVVALARANYAEGRDQIRRCVRAVYERKKAARLAERERRKRERYRRQVRLGIAHRLGGEGDHFS